MLIVGLGNPGEEYAETFHNCGFCTVDKLATSLGKTIERVECKALTCVTQIGGEKIVLAKPLTYMNLSGEAVKGLLTKYGMKTDELIVCYDDIDIARFTLRVRASGSAGTHNGMRNIVEKLCTENFKRVRVGIGRNQYALKDYVLSRFSKEDKPHFDKLFQSAAQYIENYLRDGDWDKFMREANSYRE